MKPQHLFWLTCVASAALAPKLALDGERYVTLLVVACAIASAANALRPDANRRPFWADVKRLLGIHRRIGKVDGVQFAYRLLAGMLHETDKLS